MDEILNTSETSHLGCFVNSSYLSALSYADGLLVVSSSLFMLQQMLDLCCEVCKLYDYFIIQSFQDCLWSFWFALYCAYQMCLFGWCHSILV